MRDLEECRRGHFWVVIAPTRQVLFRYTPKHNGAAVDSMLKEYEGVLVADAHSVYDHLSEDGSVTEARCWAHARSYFFKALFSEPEQAREAIAPIGKLFNLERKSAGLSAKQRKKQRQQEKFRPIVDAFFDWCDVRVDSVLDETPLAKAIATSATNAMPRTPSCGMAGFRRTTTAPSASFGAWLSAARTGCSSATTTLARSARPS